MRETFNNWTPTYFVEGVGLDKGRRSVLELAVPFLRWSVGLVAGILGDRFGRGMRAAIILDRDVTLRADAGGAWNDDFAGRSREALILVSAVAFLLIGPYSYLAGAISLDFGGKRGGATACGIIDGVGYLFGGVVAGKVVANLSVLLGWQGVFKMLAVVALLTSLVAVFFLVDQVRPARVSPNSPGRTQREPLSEN